MEYTIEIDASRGLVKAVGDKEFVESVIEKINDLIKFQPASVPTLSATAAAHTAPAKEAPNLSSSKTGGDLSQYGNIYDVTDGKISIIADLPGKTQAAKAKKLALLYLFAKLKLGEEVVANEEIREACKAHAIYDPTNFASQMKSQKKLIIATGSKGSPNFTLKLTVPGKKAAEELARDLEAAA